APDGRVIALAARVAGSRGEVLPVTRSVDLHWRHRRFDPRVAQLTDVVIAPAPGGRVLPHGAGGASAEAQRGPRAGRHDFQGNGGIHLSPVAQLTPFVVAPTPERAIASNRAGMADVVVVTGPPITSRRHRRPLDPRSDRHRLPSGRVRAVTKLARTVLAPAPE